jgi:hypothetical protein
MATRFRKLRTRRLKHRHALKTRRHKHHGGIRLFGKDVSLPFRKVITSVNVPEASNVVVSGVNPMAIQLNKRKANATMNKINAELRKYKKEQTEKNRSLSGASDPGNP